MTISISCGSCDATFRVKDEFAGKRGKCPKCGGAVEIPVLLEVVEPLEAEVLDAASVTARAATVDPQALLQEVLGAFSGPIEPVRVPFSYRLGIVLVSVVMVALPLIYIGLIFLCAYLVYLHMVHDVFILGAARGKGAIMALIAYLAPLLIGAILVLFMIKPLFARSSKDRRTRSLTRQGEPLLFAFVDRLCEVVGAPRPQRIDVDCEVNASASFRRGMLSMLLGNDLVLTIGLPLIAGFTMRQFAGVLAHEFGHFSQGAGMRLTFVIRSISHWFTRVVYERDEWDQWLANVANGIDLRIGWIFYLARLCVWLTRQVLWVLMLIGHAVAGYMLRQMEFDADRHEARLAGSDTFASTAHQLVVLNVAAQGAHADLGEFWREGRLGDNLPKLIMVNVGQIPAELHAKISAVSDESTTGWFDSHPCDRDRIASAQAENAPGVFRLDRPARDLFFHFDDLSRGVTFDFYRGIFGPQFQPQEMHSVDALLVQQTKQKAANEEMNRFFLGQFSMLRPLRLPTAYLAAPASPKQTLQSLKDCRQRMLAAKLDYGQAFDQYRAADTQILEANQALALHRARLPIPPGKFNTPMPAQSAASRTIDAATGQIGRLDAQLQPFEEAAGARLVAALQLLFVAQVADRIGTAAQWRGECERLLPMLQTLSQLAPAILRLRNAQAALSIACEHLRGNEQNESLIATIRDGLQDLHRVLGEVVMVLGSLPYPFEHAKGQLTIREYAVPCFPDADDLGGLYEAADAVLDKLASLYVRLLSHLATMAQGVERAVGLPQLEESENS